MYPAFPSYYTYAHYLCLLITVYQTELYGYNIIGAAYKMWILSTGTVRNVYSTTAVPETADER